MATTLTRPDSSTGATVGSVPEPTRTSGPAICYGLLAAIVSVGAVLRIHGISSKVIWFDETISIGVARLPWFHFLRALSGREVCMAFYYTLLRSWLWMGRSEPYLRTLSVIFSVATIPVVYALGTRLANRKIGLLAAWFLTINAFHIDYAQEVRTYALLVFLAAAATLVFVRNVQEPSSARWKRYVLLSTLCVYSHLFGVLVVFAHFVSLLFLQRNRFELVRRDMLRSFLWLSLLIFPAAIAVVRTGPGPVNWVARTRLDIVLSFLVAFSGNGGKTLLLLELIAIFAAGLAWFAAWRAEGRANDRWAIGLTWAWLVVPIAVLLVASWIQPLFVWRYLSPSLPALALLMAIGIDRIRPIVIAWTLVAAISLAAIVGTFSSYKEDPNRDEWRRATSFVFDQARPGDDVFFFLNFGHIPFEYYRSIRRPAQEWPKPLEAFGETGLTYHDFQFEYLADSLTNSRPAGNRVWLVLVYDKDPDGRPNRGSIVSRSVFGNGRRLVDEHDFSEVTVLLYSK